MRRKHKISRRELWKAVKELAELRRSTFPILLDREDLFSRPLAEGGTCRETEFQELLDRFHCSTGSAQANLDQVILTPWISEMDKKTLNSPTACCLDAYHRQIEASRQDLEAIKAYLSSHPPKD